MESPLSNVTWGRRVLGDRFWAVAQLLVVLTPFLGLDLSPHLGCYLAVGSDPHSPPAACSAFSVKFRFIWEIGSLDWQIQKRFMLEKMNAWKDGVFSAFIVQGLIYILQVTIVYSMSSMVLFLPLWSGMGWKKWIQSSMTSVFLLLFSGILFIQ